jgi:hypothetical protein
MRFAHIGENVREVRSRIARAAERAGRDPQSVRLIAVSKSVGAEETAFLRALNITDLGENRVQSAALKTAELGSSAGEFVWHLIGHLQTNKIRRALDLFSTIHSLNSVRLALALEKELQSRPGKLLPAYVEVNLSGEAAKSGAYERDLPDIFRALRDCPHLTPVGLMTMGPRTGGEAASRACFRRLRELREQLHASGLAPETCTRLSMGMSDDYEAAVEEGSDVVRVGRSLFRPACLRPEQFPTVP